MKDLCRAFALLALGCVCPFTRVSAWGMQGPERPNILVFFVDDMGWADSSVYGSDFYETPNLKRLAERATVFRQAYAQPLCSPSRAALQTGKYPARFAMHQAITGGSKAEPTVPARPRGSDRVRWPESRSHLPLKETTVAEVVRAAGYDTWFLGKWHLGANPKYWPQKQGYQTVICVGGAGPRGGYFGPNEIQALEPRSQEGEYICERLTEDACDLIRNRSSKPFLMLLSHFNVHSPYEAKAADIERFERKRASVPRSKHQNPVMAAMLWSMDQSLGAIMACLHEEGIRENTWVVFVSDNGGVHWENMKGDMATRFPMPVTSNAPLRGGKACFYEGGVRVPFLISPPSGQVPNAECETPVHVIDLMPTIGEIAGAEVDPDSIDGMSLLPLLRDDADDFPARKLYCHFPRRTTLASTVGGSFVRDGNFKLIRHWFAKGDGEHKYELFDLSSDIGETDNLAEERPALVQQLSDDLDHWLDDTSALLPIPVTQAADH
ncbi:MAG: sulfatase [Planctomycetota bacterium]